MLRREILGVEIWECTEEEIKQVWKDTPEEERLRIWHTDEVTAHLLDDPEQLQECLERKRRKPGRI